LILHEFISPTRFHRFQLGFLQYPTICIPLMYPKTACKSFLPDPFKFPFFSFILNLTFPNVDCTHPPCSYNYGMWLFTQTLLHVFNHWLWEHSKGKQKVHTPIIISGSGLGLIQMNNSLLDPLLDLPLSCGNLSPITPSMSIYNRHYILFYYYDI